MCIFGVIIYFIILLLKLHYLRTSETGEGMKIYDSPCPESFEYFVEDNKLQYGLIRIITNSDDNYTNIIVQFNVGDQLKDYQGKLNLVDVIHIDKKRVIVYKLHFPHWYHSIPKIIKITFNQELICLDAQTKTKPGKFVTITLSHYSFLTNDAMQNRLSFVKAIRDIVYPDFKQPNLPVEIKDDNNLINSKLLFSGINSKECGKSGKTISLVANGYDACEGDHPWLAAIFLVKELRPEFLGGGNLISTKLVITAAHNVIMKNKVVSPEKIFLRLGDYNIYQSTSISNSKIVVVGKIHVHPEYQFRSADADLAILILKDEVEFTNKIKPICVWEDNDKIVGLVGSVPGWGRDETGHPTAEPKVVNLPIVSQEDCLFSHPVMRDKISKRTFCAGFRNGSGPYKGDSGSGFIIRKNDRWILRGVTSMCIGNQFSCYFGEFFIFTDVFKFLDWILEALK